LLSFRTSSSLLYLALTVVKVLALLVELGLKVDDFTLFLLLKDLELLAKLLIEFLLLLKALVEVACLTELVARLKLKSLCHVGFLPLKCLDLLAKLISITVHPVRLLAHALGIFGLKLLDHLRVGLLSIGLVIEVHLLLELERLLELLLQLLKVCLRLVTLRLKELESTFP